ncbi:unnamed protein product [Chrysoparadoxa australica]
MSHVWGLESAVAAGVCLVGCCPGGTASNLVAHLAGANVALSVLMTAASTAAAAFTTPALTKLLVGTTVSVSGSALLASCARVVLAPVLAGLCINTFLPKASRCLAAYTPFLCVAFVSLICGCVVATSSAALLATGPRLLGAVLGLHSLGFGAGYGVTRILGQSEDTARTTSIEVGMQNSALAVVLAQQVFPDPITCLPGAVSATCHSLLGSLLAVTWRLKDRRRKSS